jgi:hypothetical protein
MPEELSFSLLRLSFSKGGSRVSRQRLVFLVFLGVLSGILWRVALRWPYGFVVFFGFFPKIFGGFSQA